MPDVPVSDKPVLGCPPLPRPLPLAAPASPEPVVPAPVVVPEPAPPVVVLPPAPVLVPVPAPEPVAVPVSRVVGPPVPVAPASPAPVPAPVPAAPVPVVPVPEPAPAPVCATAVPARLRASKVAARYDLIIVFSPFPAGSVASVDARPTAFGRSCSHATAISASSSAHRREAYICLLDRSPIGTNTHSDRPREENGWRQGERNVAATATLLKSISSSG